MFKKIKEVMEFIKEKKEVLLVIGWFIFIMALAVSLT